MGTRGRQQDGEGNAAKAVQGGRGAQVTSMLTMAMAEKAKGQREGEHPGLTENVSAWQKTGLITGKRKAPARKIREENEQNCCDDPLVEERDGNAVCRNCGRVLSEFTFDHSLDFARDREGRQVKHAEPVAENLHGPRSIIDPGKKDWRGRRLSGAAELLYTRLRERNKRYGSAPKRSYFEAKLVRRGILDRLGFRDPRKISEQICCWVARHKIAQGRTLEATTAAAVYVAAVEQGFPVKYASLVACSRVSEDRLRRVVAMYLTKVPAGREDFPVKLSRAKYFTPNRHIQHYCTDLGLAPVLITQAEECALLLDKRYCSGHRPENKAAAAVKATCGESVSWNDLARLTGVQVASLKAYWQKVTPFLEALGYLRVTSDLLCDTRSWSGIRP